MKRSLTAVLAISFAAFATFAASTAIQGKQTDYFQRVADKGMHKQQPVKIKADSSRLASSD